MFISQPFDDDSPKYYRVSTVTLFDELNAIEIGYNRTPKGLYQVMNRDKYILHYVVDGRGVFCNKKFGKGDCYIVVPGELETIVADKDSPYESYWIMFKGKKALNFLKTCNIPVYNSVFKINDIDKCAEIIKDTLFLDENLNETQEAAILNSLLFRIMSIHLAQTSNITLEQTVAERIMKFIDENYYGNITIDSIAKNFNFSRNYIYTLFKKEYGISPQHYLMNLRIEKAKKLLLSENHLFINEVALAVGYSDPLYFSRIFNKKVGCSPTEYMKNKGK